MRPANFDNNVNHFGLRKNKSNTKCQSKMSPQICFFCRRNTAAPFRVNFVKHVCNTNTIIYKFFQNFLKTFNLFFGILFIRVQMHPGAKTPPPIRNPCKLSNSYIETKIYLLRLSVAPSVRCCWKICFRAHLFYNVVQTHYLL